MLTAEVYDRNHSRRRLLHWFQLVAVCPAPEAASNGC
jgi:hypothetical protein